MGIDFEKMYRAFEEGVTNKHDKKIEPLNEAARRFQAGHEKLYAPLRPLLDQYNALRIEMADENKPELKQPIMDVQKRLSELLKGVDREGESYRTEMAEIKEELVRLRKLFFPSPSDMERN